MPRQLPWINKSGESRTRVKQPAKARPVSKPPSDIDDDFFHGTILASSGKGKGKVLRDEDDSDDDLPDLPAEPSTPRTKSKNKDAFRRNRAHSSSPPLIGDDVQPLAEEMHKGVSKFDLRDDEWMMVEDEFLETAKMFTRHLHIAEYEKLKEQIEAKKKEQVQAPRPVVAGSKLSIESTMKKKAEVQEKRQRKAIRDVFASQVDDDDESVRAVASAARPTSTLKRPFIPANNDSDSEDLDISKPTFKRPPRPAVSDTGPTSAVRPSAITGPKSASSAPSFAKPTSPSPAKSHVTTSRKSRATPFDMLDDYIPRAKRPDAPPGIEECKASAPTSARTMASLTSSEVSRPAHASPPASTKGIDDWDLGLSKETAERIAKRKAARENEGKEKKKVGLDDIPTFLV
ncbi:hypothetical protein BDU57DRAFT_523667 [Ampelomyces quisqualis]|uniref:Uncharacterized protein n=1 Tax=Ampelomyces quisqualis TaxID=50730 RepID=A0A6A5QA02_AMPQU|nr:hypothetical protein BDU57DRAFT_523667 [Ampelomyces quisqualis]